MLRWLVLVQAVVYLLLMPWLRSGAELGYSPPFVAAWVATIGLVLGSYLRLADRAVQIYD